MSKACISHQTARTAVIHWHHPPGDAHHRWPRDMSSGDAPLMARAILLHWTAPLLQDRVMPVKSLLYHPIGGAYHRWPLAYPSMADRTAVARTDVSIRRYATTGKYALYAVIQATRTTGKTC
ncbi:hypothetical protein AVEN_51392-1 [Araneus ventricosus]|uniref:Uncharacterized protein n=1 Tax=Araneus ventricosus TaxID=182803 RepID=A0A4Y2NRF5_ARAVE|nr:hypothetical protein AVEN_51392-1 [Araneus ventricosus]